MSAGPWPFGVKGHWRALGPDLNPSAARGTSRSGWLSSAFFSLGPMDGHPPMPPGGIDWAALDVPALPQLGPPPLALRVPPGDARDPVHGVGLAAGERALQTPAPAGSAPSSSADVAHVTPRSHSTGGGRPMPRDAVELVPSPLCGHVYRARCTLPGHGRRACFSRCALPVEHLGRCCCARRYADPWAEPVNTDPLASANEGRTRSVRAQ